MTTEGRCYVHGFELAEAVCRNCGYEFCAECVVYAFGANKPPYCVACALAAAGVRSNAARQPTMSRREIKRIEKEKKQAEKAKAKAVANGPKVEAAPAGPVAVPQKDTWPGAPAAATPVEEDPFSWADDAQRVPY